MSSSEDRAQLALRAAGMGSFAWYPAEDRCEPDAQMLALFGLPADSTLSLRTALEQLVHPLDRALYAAGVARALDAAGTGALHEEVRVIHPSGAERWLAITAQMAFAGTPRRPTKLVGVAYDITARKTAELSVAEALRKNEQWLAGLKEAFQASVSDAPLETTVGVLVRAAALQFGDDARCACYMVSQSGQELHHVAGMTEAYAACVDGLKVGADSLACGLAVFSNHPVITADVTQDERWKPWLYLAAQHDYRACWAFPVETAAGKVVGTIAIYFQRPREASPHDLEVAAALTQAAGLILARHQNIAERNEAAELLRTSEQRAQLLLAQANASRHDAESANKAKDEFLATLSHELRTPVAAILLWADALRSGAISLTEIPRAVDAIAQSAQSQSRLVEDLVDMSRLVSGKLSLAILPTYVPEVVREAVDMMTRSMLAKGLTFDVQVQDRLGTAMLDGSRIRQVLGNLLANAAKFTPEAGTVSLRVRKAGGELEVEVTDTGEGIDPAFMPHLFERFTQVDTGEARQHMGLGIGLALAKQLVTLHAGSITAHSAGRGHGAEFRVRLPWVEPQVGDYDGDGDEEYPAASAEVTEAPIATLKRLAGLVILLVEDDPNTRDGMTWNLSQAGAQVVSVSSAREALEAVRRDDFDVIVSDLGLPGVSGFELVEQVVKLYEARGLPVPPSCAVSAHARDLDRQRAVAAGFDMYLTKPITAERLIEAVGDLRDILR